MSRSNKPSTGNSTSTKGVPAPAPKGDTVPTGAMVFAPTAVMAPTGSTPDLVPTPVEESATMTPVVSPAPTTNREPTFREVMARFGMLTVTFSAGESKKKGFTIPERSYSMAWSALTPEMLVNAALRGVTDKLRDCTVSAETQDEFLSLEQKKFEKIRTGEDARQTGGTRAAKGSSPAALAKKIGELRTHLISNVEVRATFAVIGQDKVRLQVLRQLKLTTYPTEGRDLLVALSTEADIIARLVKHEKYSAAIAAKIEELKAADAAAASAAAAEIEDLFA